MAKQWDKSETNTGIPYYINHITERTQWDHPDLKRHLQNLESMNNIRFAAYRTAMKLRTLQKLLHLDVVDLSTVDSAFDQHGFRFHNDTVMDAVQLYNIIYEMYFLTKSRGRSTMDVNSCSDLLLNWILNLYDTSRTGCLRVLSVKIGMTVLCAGRITDKYKYQYFVSYGSTKIIETSALTVPLTKDLYQQVADRPGGVSKKNMTALLQDIMQIAEMIREAEAFGKNANAAVSSCFQTVLGSTVTKERFMEWFKAEPQTVVWLPTMHRLATAETMKHEVKCNICKMHPIVGFRYKCLKCLNYDLCQDCFFTGRVTKGHKYTHPTQEYCLGASSKEDVRAFAKTVRNKLSKKHGRRIKQKYLPIDDSEAEWDTSSHRSEPVEEVDTHIKMGQLSKRLAAVESMQPPDGAFVGLPGSAPYQGTGQPATDDDEDDDDMERTELEDLIDQLEQENEDLLTEMENLRQARSRLSHHIQDSGNESSDEDSLQGGGRRGRGHSIRRDESLRQQNEMMKTRQEVLEENNQELERQLQQLKELMRKKYLSRHVQDTPSVPQFGHLGAPPPYHNPHPGLRHTPNPMDRTAPPRLAYQSNQPDGDLSTHSRIPDVSRNNLLHSTPYMSHQSPSGIDMIDSQQAPPSGLSLAATPGARRVDQSMATSDLIDRNMLLPPHLADQSSVRFPALGVSRAFPSEEEELEDLVQKLDEAYPVNFTYDTQPSPCQPLPSNLDYNVQLPPPDPQGRRGGHPQDMLTAAARVGQAMSTLVSRVAAADAV